MMTFAWQTVVLIVAAVPLKHHAHISETEVRLLQAKQRQQHIKNVCSRLNESHEIAWVKFFVSDERKYIYCSIPKAACSSWKLTLLRLTGKDISRVRDVHNWRITDRILKRGSNYNSSQRETRLKKYFKFMFVREPLERLVSAYLDKCFRDRSHVWLPTQIRQLRHSANNTGKTSKHYRFLKAERSRSQLCNIKRSKVQLSLQNFTKFLYVS